MSCIRSLLTGTIPQGTHSALEMCSAMYLCIAPSLGNSRRSCCLYARNAYEKQQLAESATKGEPNAREEVSEKNK